MDVIEDTTYIPTTEDIREAWAHSDPHEEHPFQNTYSTFDSWLAKHNAEIIQAERERLAIEWKTDAWLDVFKGVITAPNMYTITVRVTRWLRGDNVYEDRTVQT